MRRSLPELSGGGAGGSALEDFLSRLRPYPPPPDFGIALWYAAAGSGLALVAAAAAALLPSGEDLQGDGFHAVGVGSTASVLNLVGALALPIAILGVGMLWGTAFLAVRNRSSSLIAGLLILPPLLGVTSAIAVGVGWLLLLALTVLNALLWLTAIVLVLIGAGIALRGEVIAGLLLCVLAIALASALENAASPSTDGSHVESPVERAGQPPNEPVDRLPAEVQRLERERDEAERRKRHLAKMRRLLGEVRTHLEHRLAAEYRAWLKVPYAAPCDESNRRAQLTRLKDQFDAMGGWLRKAQRNGANGRFLRVKNELQRVVKERRRALVAPDRFHYLYGMCPSPTSTLRWRW